MKNIRRSISYKVQRLTAYTAAVALAASACVSLGSMVSIRWRVQSSATNLGNSASRQARQTLIYQTEENALELIRSKAALADARLGQFASWTEMLAQYAEAMYASPNRYIPRDVPPPNPSNTGTLAMQRTLANDTVSMDKVGEEVRLLGAIEDVFAPLMNAHSDVITTIYIGTENGVLLSYDKNSDLSSSTAGEEYYDYFSSAWYRQAQTASEPFFTDAYSDSYGRGLTLSCAAPIRDESGKFLGAVGMDILVSDMNNEIIDIKIGTDSYALLVDSNGNIIASPKSLSESGIQNIYADETFPAQTVDKILSGSTGVVKIDSGVYYAYTPISDANWTLAVHIPESGIVATADAIQASIVSNTRSTIQAMDIEMIQTMLFFLVMFCAVFSAALFASKRFAKRLAEPVARLSRDADEISRGNLEHRSAVRTDDEIGVLAESFNEMSASLQRHIADLTEITAEKERLGAELAIASQIQTDTLPRVFPPFPERREFDIYASTVPAKEVGGDFYDFFMVDDDHLALVMADVSGKGVPAALFMMTAKTLIKSAVLHGLSPKATLESVNDQLCENNDAEMFVTVWLGVLQVSTGNLVCANAGHEYPAVKHTDGKFELLMDPHGFVLAGMENSMYEEYTLSLAPRDKLFVYTDGVPEATNSANELFGTERMLRALNASVTRTCEEQLCCVRHAVDEFAAGAPQFDDITMLCLQLNAVGTLFVDLTEPNALEKMSAFVENQLSTAAVPEDVQAMLEIVVDELGSNIVRYSGATHAAIKCEEKGGKITLILRDNGIAYDPLAKPDPPISAEIDDRQEGGLGIFIVKNLADHLYYRRDKDENEILFVKSYATGSSMK